MSSFPNHIAASAAPAAFQAERVGARQDARRRTREQRAADALDPRRRADAGSRRGG